MGTKLIKFRPTITEDESVFKETISLEKLGGIWNNEEVTYSEEELTLIRDWLYSITEVIFETVKNKKHKTIEFKPQHDEEQKSDTVCESEYRRAS
jgi:hypothetical protein